MKQLQKNHAPKKLPPIAHCLTEKDLELSCFVIAHCTKLLAETDGSSRQAFVISGTENIGLLDLKVFHYPVGEWALRASAVRKDTDWMISNFVWTGNRDEVVSQMLEKAGQEEILNAVLALSDRVDQHWK